MDLWLIFLTGLTVGGLTCLVVQGGLLTSTVALNAKQRKPVNFTSHALPVLAFLLSKLLAYSMIIPPRFLTNLVAKQNQNQNLFTPILLGFLTVFIPCGTSLAIEALAISSASPLLGAAIMAVFVLGSLPLFFSIGYLTSSLGSIFRQSFLKISAWI